MTLRPTVNGSIAVTGTHRLETTGYPYGTVVTITATPDAHYHLVTFTGAASGSINPVDVTITAGPVDTSTSLASDVNPSTVGQPVTFTATVGFDSPGREPLKCTVRQE